MLRLKPDPKYASLVKRERIERVAGGDEDLLPAVDQVGFRRVRHLSDLRVPQRVAIRRIERDEVTGDVAAEQQLSCGRQQPRRAARAADGAELVLPHGLAGLVVDRA